MAAKYIYGLFDPGYPEQFRYIGESVSPQQRLHKHISEAKKNSKTYKDIWINQLLKDGRRPQARIISQTSVEQREEDFIRCCKTQGMILLNMTDNGQTPGQGGKLISQAEIERIRQSLGLPFTGLLFNGLTQR